MYTIARNCLREYARIERKRVEVATAEVVIQKLVDQQYVEQLDAALPRSLQQFPRLLALISELSPRDQRLLYLRHVKRLSWPEIAQYFDFVNSVSLLKVHAGRLANRLQRRALAINNPSGNKEDHNE